MKLRSNSDKNPGREFFKCSRPKDGGDQCDFFQWLDGEVGGPLVSFRGLGYVSVFLWLDSPPPYPPKVGQFLCAGPPDDFAIWALKKESSLSLVFFLVFCFFLPSFFRRVKEVSIVSSVVGYASLMLASALYWKGAHVVVAASSEKFGTHGRIPRELDRDRPDDVIREKSAVGSASTRTIAQ